jgi:hypothetical protein
MVLGINIYITMKPVQDRHNSQSGSCSNTDCGRISQPEATQIKTQQIPAQQTVVQQIPTQQPKWPPPSGHFQPINDVPEIDPSVLLKNKPEIRGFGSKIEK